MAEKSRAQEIAAELLGLPLDEFTRARDARVRELRAAGEKDVAAEIKGLRKPSVTVWALNQLARSEAPRLRALVQTAEQLRSTSDAGGFRSLSDRYRDQIEELARRAEHILTGSGHGAASARGNEIALALRTAASSSNPEALLGGLLSELPAATDEDDLSTLWALSVAPAKSTRKKAPGKDKPQSTPSTAPDPAAERARKQLERLEKQAAEARAQLRELETAAEEAEHEAASAEREAARTARAAERARSRAEKAGDKLEEIRAKIQQLAE